MKKIFFACSLTLFYASLCLAQTKSKPVYDACQLKDSIDKHLVFIQQNINRIFVDTAECKQTLLDSIGQQYITTKNKKYLDALSNLRNVGTDKVQDYYTDVIKRFVETDFAEFVNDLYLGKGKYIALEKELVSTLNMIVDGRPFKTKYIGLLNVEISKAKDKKDTSKTYFLEKLKTRIEADKY